MTLQEYIASLRGRTVAVIGIGVSNTPLLRLLLREGIAVTACDRSDRAKLGALAEELEAAVEDYRVLLYNHVFDKKNRVEGFFTLTE